MVGVDGLPGEVWWIRRARSPSTSTRTRRSTSISTWRPCLESAPGSGRPRFAARGRRRSSPRSWPPCPRPCETRGRRAGACVVGAAVAGGVRAGGQATLQDPRCEAALAAGHVGRGLADDRRLGHHGRDRLADGDRSANDDARGVSNGAGDGDAYVRLRASALLLQRRGARHLLRARRERDLDGRAGDVPVGRGHRDPAVPPEGFATRSLLRGQGQLRRDGIRWCRGRSGASGRGRQGPPGVRARWCGCVSVRRTAIVVAQTNTTALRRRRSRTPRLVRRVVEVAMTCSGSACSARTGAPSAAGTPAAREPP